MRRNRPSSPEEERRKMAETYHTTTSGMHLVDNETGAVVWALTCRQVDDMRAELATLRALLREARDYMKAAVYDDRHNYVQMMTRIDAALAESEQE
jgi:hypothetical protein